MIFRPQPKSSLEGTQAHALWGQTVFYSQIFTLFDRDYLFHQLSIEESNKTGSAY